MDHEVYKIVCLSTAHLLPATSAALTATPDLFGFVVGNFEDGHFVSAQHINAPDPEGTYADDTHPSVLECRRWAKEQGYQYIMFDADGPQVDGLPVYEW